ncbi:unnamed protein product [Brassicogethes aeneus]|uniref:Queuine tRNA-ribosyltransferase accessory subunit 2 n=1 Tax=Brassicogethes aeneus TaxID=1431903 RepID=A0A9P0F919_BRAAE|nr:unnamed protein product [Brassicogethes aeneus]
MKFTVQNVSKLRPRIGTLSNFGERKNGTLETPMLLLHSQGGQIPHITHEVFKLISKDAHILQIPLTSMHNFQETLEQYNGTITDFIGSKESLSCITFHDPSNITRQGHHAKNKVPLWTKNGIVYYDAPMYCKVLESYKPDMYFFISDGDTNKGSQQKRIQKAVDTTIHFYKDCLEGHKKSAILKNSFAMASIAGGYCLKSREKCMDVMLKDSEIGGYVIDGLHNNGPEIEFIPFDEVKSVAEFVMSKIPENKLMCVQGCWNPVNIVKFIQLGVDLFDTSYCRIVTERSSALTFSVDLQGELEEYEINLREHKYADDFQPIHNTCSCFTCKNYSRGYIHHLLTVQELLGPILIMIHNIHHYLNFFDTIRQCIKENTLNELEFILIKQFKNYEDSRKKNTAEISTFSEG